MESTFTIKQAAVQVGLTTKAIRYYESLKIMNPAKRKDNKYREYTLDDMSRLRLIKQARALGLSLSEIKPLVKYCIDGKCDDLKTALVSKMPEYIVSIQQKITELQLLKVQFEKLNTALTSKATKPPACSQNCCSTIDELVQLNIASVNK
ncbi:MAG TPA: hypothetical protein DEV73_01920 [Candidatus Zambryskibacteria bacterium]|nr:hypothetical protein [Candidatus Zambryskibacteria bacterium]